MTLAVAFACGVLFGFVWLSFTLGLAIWLAYKL